MIEKRKAVRRRTLKGAHVVFNGGRSTINCIVRDLSASGALIRVESVLGVPATSFALVFTDGTRRLCRVVRMGATEIAVAFEADG